VLPHDEPGRPSLYGSRAHGSIGSEAAKTTETSVGKPNRRTQALLIVVAVAVGGTWLVFGIALVGAMEVLGGASAATAWSSFAIAAAGILALGLTVRSKLQGDGTAAGLFLLLTGVAVLAWLAFVLTGLD
jgi:hypothetical protein